MRDILISALTILIALVHFHSIKAVVPESSAQLSVPNILEDQELFKTFSEMGPPAQGIQATSYCNDCINNCMYCPKFCWPADGICNTCKSNGNSCPKNCEKCKYCPFCKKGAYCCLSCKPKPSTCDSSIQNGQGIDSIHKKLSTGF